MRCIVTSHVHVFWSVTGSQLASRASGSSSQTSGALVPTMPVRRSPSSDVAVAVNSFSASPNGPVSNA